MDSPSVEVPEIEDRRPAWVVAFDERWPGARRRITGLLLALAIELGLIALLLSLGQAVQGDLVGQEFLTSISFSPEPEPSPQAPSPSAAEPEPAAPAVTQPRPEPQPSPPPVLILPKPVPSTPPPSPPAPEPRPESKPKIRAVVRNDMQGPAAPRSSGSFGDSQLVAGTGPHGEPLYAARWYREPSHDELAGYLSTATSPGYALINCQTVPDFRVENCELVSEYPSGAGLGRAVLAAAWQFKVRPPRVGGQSMVGSWVRIRISYEQIERRSPAR